MHEYCAGMFVTHTQMQIRSSAATLQTPTRASPRDERPGLHWLDAFLFLVFSCGTFSEERRKINANSRWDMCDSFFFFFKLEINRRIPV